MKKLIAMLLALAMVLSMAACGGKDNSNDTPKNETPVVTPGQTEAPVSQEQEAVQTPSFGEIDEETLRGCAETPASEFTYVMSINYEGIMIEAYNGTSDVVVIPAVIDGQPVVEVADYIFANDSTVRGVVFPETVANLGEVFVNSTCIELVIAEGVQSIQQVCFVNCSALREVILGDGLTKIGILAFSTCAALEKVYIPASLTELSGDEKNTLFFMCTNLTVYGEAGSYIESVATEKGIPFVAE